MLTAAQTDGWGLRYVSADKAVLAKGNQRVELTFHWDWLVGKDVSGFDIEAAAPKLGLRDHLNTIARAKDEGFLYSHTLRVLTRADLQRQANLLTATICPDASSRLAKLANSVTGTAVYYFAMYDDNDHAGPAGSNEGDVSELFADAGRASLEPIRCESETTTLVGTAATSKLSEHLAKTPLQGIAKDSDGTIVFSFGLPHGESLEARVALAEEGRVESLSLRAHNQGRHGRTIFQAKDDLAAWLAKGPLSSLRWSEGDITLQGPQGPMTIRAKHLCCEAAEGENIGAQVCSNEYGYDFRFICGGWYGPGWRD